MPENLTEHIERLITNWWTEMKEIFQDYEHLPGSIFRTIRDSTLEQTLELKEEAIRNQWRPEIVAIKLETLKARTELDLIRSSGSVPLSEVLEASLARSLCLPADEYSPRILDAADNYKDLGIQELLLIAARQNGYPGRNTSIKDNVDAVLLTVFNQRIAPPGSIKIRDILSNIANKLIKRGFMGVDQAWRAITRIVSVKNFRPYTGYCLGSGGIFEKVGADGEIAPSTQIGTAESYTVQINDHVKRFVITREDIINDDLNAFKESCTTLGKEMALKLNAIFWQTFNNNSAFFTNKRGNLLTGPESALGMGGLQAAVEAFMSLKDAAGQPIGLTPKILLVPPSLGTLASRLYVNAEIYDITNGSKVLTANIFQNRFKPISTIYLNPKYGGSSTAWYLLADPEFASVIAVALLHGRETPQIENVWVDSHISGISFRSCFGFGVTLADWRTGVRCSGV